MKKLICALLVLTLLFGLAGCKGADDGGTPPANANGTAQPETTPEPKQEEEPIVFTDEALERIIREKLGKPGGGITASEAAAVTELDLQLPGDDWSIPRINDLSDLKYFPNLTSLNLNWAMNKQGGVDLTPLAGLTKLENLALACTAVKDLQPLAGLTHMKDLHLWGIRDITDISALAGMTELESLWINDNLIADVSPLAGLKSLSNLVIEDNMVSDVSPLAGLTNLKCLKLAGNPVKDYTPLSAIFQTLSEKDFELLDHSIPIVFTDPVLEAKVRKSMDVKKGDISPEMAEAVTELALGNEWSEKLSDEEKISNLKSLRYFPNLSKLELYFNNIADNVSYLTVLKAMPNLTILDLNANKLNTYFELAACKNLKFLNISGNISTDLNPLVEMKNLNALYLAYIPNLTHIDPLEHLTNLETLSLEGARIDNFWPLKNLTKLKTLYICRDADYTPDLTELAGIYPNLTDKNFEMN